MTYRITSFGTDLQLRSDTASADIAVSHGGKIWQVQVTPSLAALCWFAKMVESGPTDEWAGCNNHLGRISWALAYRLEAYGLLLQSAWSPQLRARVQGLVSTVLSHEEETDSFVTTKFSSDLCTPYHFAVTDGRLAYGLMCLRTALPPELRDRVLSYARRVVQRHEDTWDGSHYRFPPHAPIQFAGEPLPFNQQHGLGLVLVELAKEGDEKATKRVQTMLSSFEADLIETAGLKAWRYWPTEFFERSREDRRSYHTWNGNFDDTAHGAIVCDFVGRATALLGKAPLLELERLAGIVRPSPFLYSKSFGDNLASSLSVSNAPLGPFAETKVMADDLTYWLSRPIPTFNNQHLLLGYARAAIARFKSEGWRGELRVTSALGNKTVATFITDGARDCRLETGASARSYNSPIDALTDMWSMLR